MRELIVAGIRAGLGYWRPWVWSDLLPIALICNSCGFLSRPHQALGWSLLWACSLPLLLCLYAWSLYSTRFGADRRNLVNLSRLIRSWGLAALFMTVLGSLFFVVLISTLYAVASAGIGFDPAQVKTWAPAIDERGRAVASTVFLIGLAALAWAAMRVWLTSAATIAEDRVAMLSTWPYTLGRVLPMTIARVALSVPAALLLIIVLRFVRDRELAGVSFALIVTLAWFPMQIGAEVEYYRLRVLSTESKP